VILMLWGYGAGWGWGAWLTMGIGMILFWGLAIGGGIVLIRYLAGTRYQHPSSGAPGRTEAEQILAERFARGDIDEDEYRRRCELLRSGG
jgi:putative membrane protein